MGNEVDNKLIDVVFELNSCGSILVDLKQMVEEHRELKDGFWLALNHLYKGSKILKEFIRDRLK